MKNHTALLNSFILALTIFLVLDVLPVLAMPQAKLYDYAHASRLSPSGVSDDFVITVNTNNPGLSSKTQFIIPTTGNGYNYNVDCDNDGADEATGVTGDYTCNYAYAGTFTIRIKNNNIAGTGFPRIYFNNSGDRLKILTVEQWGTGKWDSMANAFYGCENLTAPASDAPDLSNVSDMSGMFRNACAFNQDISAWDTSNVTDMSYLFCNASAFNQGIGAWDTSNVTDMSYMFHNASAFNRNIEAWSTSYVTNMRSMFYGASVFNQWLNVWDTTNVTDMSYMFYNADAFNQPIGGWNTASVTDMGSMFANANAFNQDIDNWNTINVTDMSSMFKDAPAFNQDIGFWNTGSVTSMRGMFDGASAFNQPLGDWDTTSVTNMAAMFERASAFDQEIGFWNTGNVTDMSYMFYNADDFSRDIGFWNTGNVTNMSAMFMGAVAFNQDISGWNTGSVTNMSYMFDEAHAFDQDIGDWNTANVTDMHSMFYDAYAFNEDIGYWNTANVTDMHDMFYHASGFNQDIGNWNVTSLNDATDMFAEAQLSTVNYDALLLGWDAQTLKPNVTFGAGNSAYCVGEEARANMISSDGWVITDGGKGCTGEAHCGGVGVYTFSTQSGVVIDVTSTGANLACLYVEEVDSAHPYGPPTADKYWQIDALQSNGSTPATPGYLVNLTLTHDNVSDPQVCRYTDPGWNCDSDSADASTVTRNNIDELSDWEVDACKAAATPGNTNISLGGMDVNLTWNDNSAANAGGYEMHRSTSPYFTPDSGSLHETMPAGSTSYTDVGGAGAISENHYYIVRGLSNCQEPSSFEKRLGEFDFELVPGVN